ncbi:MAG: hypothetical protein KAS32_01800 [Candidatus Peribacteraceae bacterium]|nr:hypothetical protein [Candidatus Peribacteraceae bacterium]
MPNKFECQVCGATGMRPCLWPSGGVDICPDCTEGFRSLRVEDSIEGGRQLTDAELEEFVAIYDICDQGHWDNIFARIANGKITFKGNLVAIRPWRIEA